MHLNDFELKFVFFSLSRKIDKEEEKKIATTDQAQLWCENCNERFRASVITGMRHTTISMKSNHTHYKCFFSTSSSCRPWTRILYRYHIHTPYVLYIIFMSCSLLHTIRSQFILIYLFLRRNDLKMRGNERCALEPTLASFLWCPLRKRTHD